jgi:glutamate---cysteine ligase / carboxylate-amine ligase
MDLRTVGVEEELLLVEPSTGRPRAVSGAVLRTTGEHIGAELQREQLEVDTRPCKSLDELAGEVRDRRHAAADAARTVGAEVIALATSPLPVEPSLTPKPRYQWMAHEYGLTADETLTCGCHVHVEVSSDDEGVAVLDRIRPWLPPLVALSANSPFWQGRDTEYASYRQRVWCRWPSAGPAGPFGSADAYHDTVRLMIDSGTLLDEGMIYFDARLSRHYPTVEVRVGDVCLEADDTVLLAALARALVETAARAWRAGDAPAPVRTELLRLAAWRASRSGLTGELIHPEALRPAPAAAVMHALLDHVAPVLADGGELATVKELLSGVLARGSGAEQQRAVYRRRNQFGDVVAHAVIRTTDS